MRDDPKSQSNASANPVAVSRRDSFRLASGMVALGAGLGIAVQSGDAKGAATPVRLQLKFIKQGADQKPVVLHTVTLPDDVAQALSDDGGATIQIKWFRQAEGAEAESLGVHPFPATLQLKYALKLTIKGEAIKMTNIKQSSQLR
jgi:hypothetical protein